MKKLVIMLLITLTGFQMVSAQKGDPIRPYGDYSIEDTKAFALGESSDSKKFRTELVQLVRLKMNEAGYGDTQLTVSGIFDYMQIQEVWLEARQFKNSRWDSSRNIEFYISESRYEGNAGIFVYKEISFPVYKVSCMNLLYASLNGVAKKDHTVMVPKQVTVSDTIYQKVWVEAPQERENIRVEVICSNESSGYGPNYGYQEPYYMPLLIPSFYWGWNASRNNGDHYSTTNIDNSSYYYNNQVTNTTTTNTSNTHSNYNYSNNNNNYGSPTYPPTPDTGGPGGAGMNTNTGNGYGGPGGTGMNNNSNGYGGPGGTSTNGTGGPGGTGGGAGMNTNLGNNTNQNSSTGIGMNTNTSRRNVATGNNQRVKSRDINPQARTSNEDGIYSNIRMESRSEVISNEGSLSSRQTNSGNKNRSISSNNNQASKPANNSGYGSNNRSSSSNNQARQSSNQQSRSSNGYGSNNRSSSSNRQANYGSNNRQANNSGYGSNNRSSSSNRQASSNGYGSNRRN